MFDSIALMDMADKKIGADRVVTSPPNRRKE
jgi:hypothetical protein